MKWGKLLKSLAANLPTIIAVVGEVIEAVRPEPVSAPAPAPKPSRKPRKRDVDVPVIQDQLPILEPVEGPLDLGEYGRGQEP